MNELTLQIIASLKLLTVCAYATLYGLGGMFWRQQLRRLGGSLLITLAIAGFSVWTRTFSYYYLFVLPLVYGATSIGYGASSTGIKIFKRAYCGLAYALVALPIALVTGNWIMFALHTTMCLGVSITLGVTNPTNARYEESLIGATIATMPLFMA